MTALSKLKPEIYTECLAQLDARIHMAKESIKMVQEGVEEETKSSAGDKFETGIEMFYVELEKHHNMLKEAQNMKDIMLQFSPSKFTEDVQHGSLIRTDRGLFYLTVALGKIKAAGTDVLVISPSSPLGSQLLGKTPSQSVSINGQHFSIQEVR
ncbi:MAG: 3-oxoacyl-ACP synthase [Cytophagales bacterium]|nr:3-oxoacyl-ACP synthase [Cytophagales bacterium]